MTEENTDIQTETKYHLDVEFLKLSEEEKDEVIDKLSKINVDQNRIRCTIKENPDYDSFGNLWE